MWRKTEPPVLRLLAALLIVVFGSSAAHADSGLLTGTLGRWLDTEAVPQLAQTLSKHPKFSGEAVQIVALRDGKPVETPSRLHQAVEAHLTQRLLQYPGVTLAWQEPQQTCGVPQKLSYLLGVEFDPPGSATASLSIGMIDVAESVWVSGVSLNWRGRLSSAETLALKSPIPGQPRGTIDSPLPLQATAEISRLLQRNVRCTLPDGLDGPVYIDAAPAAELARLRGQLQRDLNLAALVAITPDPADATWLIKVTSNPVGPRTQEIVLTLTDDDGRVNQHLASVFVTGADNGRQLPAEAQIAAIPASLPAATLLSDMQLDPYASGGVCDAQGKGPCVEVSFEMTRDAYLFVLSTSDRELHASSCEVSTQQASAGKRLFRLRVTPAVAAGTADAGVYAIAAVDREVARAIARHIRKAPGACARASRAGLADWLRQFDALLQKYPGSYEWRAVHLVNNGNELVQI